MFGDENNFLSNMAALLDDEEFDGLRIYDKDHGCFLRINSKQIEDLKSTIHDLLPLYKFMMDCNDWSKVKVELLNEYGDSETCDITDYDYWYNEDDGIEHEEMDEFLKYVDDSIAHGALEDEFEDMYVFGHDEMGRDEIELRKSLFEQGILDDCLIRRLDHDEGDMRAGELEVTYLGGCDKCPMRCACDHVGECDMLRSEVERITNVEDEDSCGDCDECCDCLNEDYDDEGDEEDEDALEDEYHLKLMMVDREINITSIGFYDLIKPLNFKVDLISKGDIWFWENEEFDISCVGKSYEECLDDLEKTIACMIHMEEFPDGLRDYINPDEFMDVNDWN